MVDNAFTVADEDGKKIVIVGGVAGGASCATRARRLSEKAEIMIFERGHNISFANCGLPYYISDVIDDRCPVGEKVWMRCACVGASGKIMDFYFGTHEYAG